MLKFTKKGYKGIKKGLSNINKGSKGKKKLNLIFT